MAKAARPRCVRDACCRRPARCWCPPGQRSDAPPQLLKAAAAVAAPVLCEPQPFLSTAAALCAHEAEAQRGGEAAAVEAVRHAAAVHNAAHHVLQRAPRRGACVCAAESRRWAQMGGGTTPGEWQTLQGTAKPLFSVWDAGGYMQACRRTREGACCCGQSPALPLWHTPGVSSKLRAVAVLQSRSPALKSYATFQPSGP